MAQKQSCLPGLVAWLLAVGTVAVTAIALVTSRYGWPIYLEIFSHFQRQYWLVSWIALGGIVLTRRALPALVALACVAALTMQVLPWYLPPHFLTMGDRGDLRVLISNVNTQNMNYEAVLNFTRQEDPDIALFMEVDDGWIAQLQTLTVELPYASENATPYSSGIALYSRYPLQAEVIDFSDASTPSITATVDFNGQPLSLLGTHPLPPVKPTFFHSRNQQLDLMGQYLQTIDGAKIVFGDFNMTMWSPYHRRFMRQADLTNTRDGFGIRPSWPTKNAYRPIPGWLIRLLTIPIDQCFVTADLRVSNVHIGPNVSSDHYPVVFDLML